MKLTTPMKLTKLLTAALLLTGLPSPAQMNYQGRLTGAGGQQLSDGQYVIEFSLWDAVTDGTMTWGPYVTDGSTGNGHGPRADLVNGNFNVIIGSLDTSNRELALGLAGGDRYLQIKVGTNAPITPRQMVLASPRALKADTADRIPYVTSVGPNVGIGTSSPEAKLDVAGLLKVGNGGAAPPAVGRLGGAGQRLILWPGDTTNPPYGFGIESGTMWSCVPADSAHKWYSGTTTAMTLKENGSLEIRNKAAIGTSLSSENLLVGTSATDSTATAKLGLLANGGHKWVMESVSGFGGGFGNGATGSFQIYDVSTNPVTHGLTINQNGNVGIGTTSPTTAKLVINGSLQRTRSGNVVGYWGQNTYNYNVSDTLGIASASIFATGEILAQAFVAVSDARIKFVTGRSNAAVDLSKLRELEVTDYTYIDKIARGNRPQKKVIAQQVEKVYPQAVSRHVGCVPDIFKMAAVKENWIQLETNLKTGERVKLVSRENEENIHEILEVRKGAFRIPSAPRSSEIFVYGREVNDFRTVDYEAIAMLNVSATQELARQLEAEKADTLAKDKEIAALKERLAALEGKDAARDAKLAALEKLMEKRSGEAKAATASTVSTPQ